MTSIQPEVPEEVELTNEPEAIEERQPENTLHRQRTEDQEGISSGPIIINR